MLLPFFRKRTDPVMPAATATPAKPVADTTGTSTSTSTSTSAAAATSSPSLRVPRVGEILHFYHRPTVSSNPAAIEVCPAIVVRVADAGNPRSNVALVAFGVTAGIALHA